MPLTLTMVDTRSMVLVVLIVLSRVASVVDVCEEKHFVSQSVKPTSLNIFIFQGNWCFSACDCGVWEKSLFKAKSLPNIAILFCMACSVNDR